MSRGYSPGRTVYTLRFADPAYEGLVVRVRAQTIAEMFDAEDAVVSVRPVIFTAEDKARWTRAIELFLGCALEWNVVDDAGKPIPLTHGGVTQLEPPFMWAILVAWLNAMAGGREKEEPAPDPLEETEDLDLAGQMQPA